MTIEDLQDSLRCPDCGTWLPRAALECPQCGRPRDVVVGSTPRRARPSQRTMIAGGVAGTLVVGGVALFLLLPAEDPLLAPSPSQAPGSEIAFVTHSPSPTPRPTPKPTPRPTPSPGASLGPQPTATPRPPVVRAPLILPSSILDLGPRAIVQVPNLRVRGYVGLDADIQVQLGLGSELLLRMGPVSADGYDWYLVYYPWLIGEPTFEEGGGSGWIAAGPADSPPTFIAVEPSRCPVVPVTAALVASMSELARTDCLAASGYEFTGVVETCYEGPITPYTYEPEWLGFSCYFIYELGTTAWLAIYIPPSLTLPATFGRGDVVRVVGRVNDPRAADCRATSTEAIDSSSVNIEDQSFRLRCRSSFVLSELEVTGHINLPNPFGT